VIFYFIVTSSFENRSTPAAKPEKRPVMIVDNNSFSLILLLA